MEFIDMHCDTLSILLLTDRENAQLYQVKGAMVDLARMKKAGQLAQFFAVFLPAPGMLDQFGLQDMSDEAYIQTLRGYLLKNVEEYSSLIAMAYHARDLIDNKKQGGKMSAVLTMEDGRAIDGKLENIKRFYDLGFRAISLTWNMPNCLGAPNSNDPVIMGRGLTEFGREAVEYMQELGILADVSHLSEGGFYDVASICKKPFIASHSNSRALCPHPRNLTDGQLRTLADAGGVAGLNFGPEFLNRDIRCRDSTAELIAAHARHMADVGGVECVGIGSDFDGIQGNLEISDCSKMFLLEDALRKKGFTSSEVEKIFCQNVLRVMKDAMK